MHPLVPVPAALLASLPLLSFSSHDGHASVDLPSALRSPPVAYAVVREVRQPVFQRPDIAPVPDGLEEHHGTPRPAGPADADELSSAYWLRPGTILNLRFPSIR